MWFQKLLLKSSELWKAFFAKGLILVPLQIWMVGDFYHLLS